MEKIEDVPRLPDLSLKNIITRPFGDQVGASSRKDDVNNFSSLPSVRITPM
jgi:hypothetical protein